jgi:competence protein ComFC
MVFLQQIGKNFLDILYPDSKFCLICRKNYRAEKFFCKKCTTELEKWQRSRAGYKKLPVGKTGNSAKFSYQAFYAPAPYRGVFKQAIQKLKYGKKTHLVTALGETMAAYLRNNTRTHFDWIVPIPLTSRKEAQRGFNQGLLLAEVVSQKLQIPLEKSLLLKKIETKPQAHLKKDKRLNNLKGAFSVSRKIEGKPTILLVDDIITTGVTVQEAARTLRKAGAGQIEVLVWARSIGEYT